MHPILIIGAGPAGTMAALRLAGTGMPVTLIEQHLFPRDKVCGECLSSLAIDVLRRAGISAGSFSVTPTQFTRTRIVAQDGSEASFPLNLPMWGLSRRNLDTFLQQAAVEAGAKLLSPARVEQIHPGDSPSGVVRNLSTNEVSTINGSTILLADGRGAFLQHRPKPTGDLGIKSHFSDIDADRHAIALFSVAGAYVVVAPIENNRWNIACNVPVSIVRAHAGNSDAILQTFRQQNSGLDRALRHASREEPWLVSPLPRFAVQSRWLDNVIPLGNAAAALEPIGGEGMGLALRSAELAAEEIIKAHAANRSVNTRRLRAQYQSLWRTRRLACRATAVVLSSARYSSSLIELARITPAIGRSVMRLMGKPCAKSCETSLSVV